LTGAASWLGVALIFKWQFYVLVLVEIRYERTITKRS